MNTNSDIWETVRNNSFQSLTPFTSYTHCGIRFDLLKSLMQKGIRRGNESLVRFCIEEAFLIGRHNNNNNFYKGKINNICNRLAMIAIEDVSPRCVTEFNYTMKNINRFSHDNDNFNALMNAALMLTKAKKSRICSHLRLVCCHSASPIFQELLLHYSSSNDDDDDDDNNNNDNSKIDNLNTMLSNILLKLNNDDNDDDIISTNIINNDDNEFLNNKRIRCAFYLGQMYRLAVGLKESEKFIYNAKNSPMRKAAKKMNLQKLWETLITLAQSPIVKQCIIFKRQLFENREFFDEEFLCLLSAVETLISELYNVHSISSNTIDDDNNFSIEENWIELHCNKGKELMIPIYALDRHVRGGNHSMRFFLEYGAYVENEDKEWSINWMKTKYEHLRMIINNNIKNDKKRKREEKEHFLNNNNDKMIKLDDLFSFDNYIILKVCNPNTKKGTILLAQRKENNCKIIIKEMRKTLNYGKDQLACHEIKELDILGLDLFVAQGPEKARLVKSLLKFDKVTERIEKVNKPIYQFICNAVEYKDNMQNELQCTRNFSNVKKILTTDRGYKMLISIILYRAIMGITDTNFSNVLCDGDKFYSIDENFIGKLEAKKILSMPLVIRMLTVAKQCYPQGQFTDIIPTKVDLSKLENTLQKYRIKHEQIIVVKNNLKYITSLAANQ